MEWNAIEAGWNEYKGNAQRRWNKLSVEQVAGTEGKREQLSAQLQHAYGTSPEEADKQIADWMSRQSAPRVDPRAAKE